MSDENKVDKDHPDPSNPRIVRQYGPFNCFGGPHHKGHPDDTRLRVAEKDLYIGKLRRDRAYDLCDDITQVFLKCAETGAFNMIFRKQCQEERKAMEECLVKTFRDPAVKKEVTDKYLALRREYRATGLSLKERNRIKADAENLAAGKPLGDSIGYMDFEKDEGRD